MIRSLAGLLLLVAGCLPAYDNGIAPSADGGGSGDGGGDGGSDVCSAGSGKFVTGRMYHFEKSAFANGPVLRIEGCDRTTAGPGLSPPSDGNGVKLEIPKAYFDALAPKYLIAEGNLTASGTPILKSWFAPRIIMNGGRRTTDMVWHFFGPDMGNIRDSIAKELAAAGRIDAADGASGAAFAMKYSFAFGATIFYSDFGFNDVAGTTFSIDGDTNADKASCDPKASCCVYYAYSFEEFYGGLRSTLLELGAGNSPSGFFAVVCPETPGMEKPEITLTQTATTLHDKQSNFQGNIAATTMAPFPPIQIPRKRGDGVVIDWLVQEPGS